METTCPSCKSAYQVDDSKIPDKGIYGRCPKCQQRFLITKQTPENPVEAFMKKFRDSHPEIKHLGAEKAIKKEENKKDSSSLLSQFSHTIKNNKPKAVLFVTAGILALMLLFPPFHIVVGGNDMGEGYSFFIDPPYSAVYSKLKTRIDTVTLLVQCLIVAVIGMICWLAFRNDETSESFKEKFIVQKKGETGAPPPTEALAETSVRDKKGGK